MCADCLRTRDRPHDRADFPRGVATSRRRDAGAKTRDGATTRRDDDDGDDDDGDDDGARDDDGRGRTTRTRMDGADADDADGSKDAKLMVMDDVGGCRAVRAKEILEASGFKRVVIARGGANAWKSAWDSNTRRRQLPGSFSRGFDNPMFADSNVVAEEFGASSDDTVWIV